MKITSVEVLPVDQYLFTKVHTDAGITGLGESGTWGFLEASAAAMEKFGRYLVGQDPLRIEHHWQYMYRSSHFRGAAIMGALSALDNGLPDISLSTDRERGEEKLATMLRVVGSIPELQRS